VALLERGALAPEGGTRGVVGRGRGLARPAVGLIAGGRPWGRGVPGRGEGVYPWDAGGGVGRVGGGFQGRWVPCRVPLLGGWGGGLRGGETGWVAWGGGGERGGGCGVGAVVPPAAAFRLGAQAGGGGPRWRSGEGKKRGRRGDAGGFFDGWGVRAGGGGGVWWAWGWVRAGSPGAGQSTGCSRGSGGGRRAGGGVRVSDGGSLGT